MRSLWAYIEGMDGLHLLFTGANSSNLAAWARFGTLDHFDGHLLLQNSSIHLNVLQHVCTCYLGPMRSLWPYIEGMVGLSLPITATNSSDLAAGSDLALWPSSKRDLLLLYVLVRIPILLRSCIYVFMTHEEPLGIY